MAIGKVLLDKITENNFPYDVALEVMKEVVAISSRYREDRLEKWRLWGQMRDDYRPPLTSDDMESNYHVPDTSKRILAMLPRALQGLFSTRPYSDVRPRGKKDAYATHFVRSSTDFWFERSRIPEIFEDVLDGCATYGTSFIRHGIVRRTAFVAEGVTELVEEEGLSVPESDEKKV